MTPVDAADDAEPGFEASLEEGLSSLREAHPDARSPDAEGLESLTALLAPDRADAVQRDAARMLAMLAERFPDEVAPAVPDIAERLDDPSGRTYLLRALGNVASTEPECVGMAAGALGDLLDADDSSVVRDATWVLSTVADADPDAVADADAFSAFVRLLSHDDEEVRRRAAGGLATAPPAVLTASEGTLDRLLSLLDSSSVYRTAGRTLVATAPTFGDGLVEGLVAHLESGRPARREHAAWTLAQLADEHPGLVQPRWETLVDIVRDDDDHQVQNSVAAALAAIATAEPEPAVLSALGGLLDHDDRFVRRYGCLALGDVAVATGAEAALDALAGARTDEAPLVAQQAEESLAAAAADHPEAVARVAPDLVAPDD